MKFFKSPWFTRFLHAAAIIGVAYAITTGALSQADIDRAEEAIVQVQHVIIHNHEGYEVLGLEPGCADEWHQFWAWLTNNACAGGSRN